jgi:hypothetical protein
VAFSSAFGADENVLLKGYALSDIEQFRLTTVLSTLHSAHMHYMVAVRSGQYLPSAAPDLWHWTLAAEKADMKSRGKYKRWTHHTAARAGKEQSQFDSCTGCRSQIIHLWHIHLQPELSRQLV